MTNTLERNINKRLKTLELAQRLGNISAACRFSGMDRTSFYEWQRRFDRHGIEGLENRSSAPKAHPFTTPPRTVEKIIDIALQNPEWGCIRISEHLSKQGLSLSSPTVQKILIQHNIGRRGDRLKLLEVELLSNASEISNHQLSQLEQFNPSLRERVNKCEGPGEKLAQRRLLIGKSKYIGNIYLQLAVDCYNLHSFAYIHRRKHSQDSVFILRNQIMPHYKRRVLQIETDTGPGYCGGINHPYEGYLIRHNITHITGTGCRKNTNGHLQRISEIIQAEFVHNAQNEIENAESLHDLQCELHRWLEHFNANYSLAGYPTFGKPPQHTA